MAYNEQIVLRTRDSLLATHQVLRNTYLLLGLTLFFSTACALFSMHAQVRQPNIWMYFIISYGLLFLTQVLRNSVWGLASVFAFTGYLGYVMGPTLNFYMHAYVNGAALISASLGGTAGIFFLLSAYTLITRKDFSFLGHFLFVGFLVVFAAMLASMFWHVPMLYLACCGAIVLISSMSILWQTSAIIHNGETNYIMATLQLYISIYNIFLSLLQIMAAFGGRRS